jgi:hypothetical protein
MYVQNPRARELNTELTGEHDPTRPSLKASGAPGTGGVPEPPEFKRTEGRLDWNRPPGPDELPRPNRPPGQAPDLPESVEPAGTQKRLPIKKFPLE